jgi:hypothetical protein
MSKKHYLREEEFDSEAGVVDVEVGDDIDDQLNAMYWRGRIDERNHNEQVGPKRAADEMRLIGFVLAAFAGSGATLVGIKLWVLLVTQ